MRLSNISFAIGFEVDQWIASLQPWCAEALYRLIGGNPCDCNLRLLVRNLGLRDIIFFRFCFSILASIICGPQTSAMANELKVILAV
ncbi:hypothetical protein SLA2020_397160 [Shorea laevis]